MLTCSRRAAHFEVNNNDIRLNKYDNIISVSIKTVDIQLSAHDALLEQSLLGMFEFKILINQV